MEDKKLIIFDFDGVFINTLDMTYKINRDTNNNLSWEEYKSFSEVNFFEGWEKAKKEKGYITPEQYHEKYERGILEYTIEDILYDTVLYLVDKYILTIVTSSNGYAVKNFMEKENLVECFTDILGTDFHKSKEYKIKFLLEKYNLFPQKAIFVTDTLGDVLEARVCGVWQIAETWGLHKRDVLIRGEPTEIIDDPIDLIKTIEKILE